MTGFTSPIAPLASTRDARAEAVDTQAHVAPSPARQGRAETYWGGPSIPPFASSAYEQLHGGEGNLFSPKAQPRRFSRILLMVAIFAVGAVVGLLAAWWLNPAFLGHQLAASNNAPSTIPMSELHVRPQAARGIGAGELPYDGAPAPGEDAPAVAARNEVRRDLISGSAGTGPKQALDRGAAAQEALSSAQDGTEEVSGEPVAVKPEPAKNADDQSQSPEPKAVKLTPKRRPIPKAVKNREIDRIRRQAEEELKKKTEAGRRAGDARFGRKSSTVAASAGPPAIRSRLARCDRAANLFRREQCKWRLCSGMWGKNGCPSYATASNTY